MIDPEIKQMIEDIRTDTTHGASQLARNAAGVFRQAAEISRASHAQAMIEELNEVGRELEKVRPAMAPLYNVVYGIMRVFEENLPGKFPEEARRIAVGLADGAVQHSYLAVARVADYAAGLLKDGDTVLTHSYSSTVIAALRRAFQEKAIEALVTRSGAGRTGGALAADLNGYGLPVTLIDDTAIGIYLSRADVVLLGADRITGPIRWCWRPVRPGCPATRSARALSSTPVSRRRRWTWKTGTRRRSTRARPPWRFPALILTLT